MMHRRVTAIAIGTLLCLAAAPAMAGDCCSGDDQGSCCLGGFGCKCACPLAKQADCCRGLGAESLSSCESLCKDHAANVASNLGKI